MKKIFDNVKSYKKLRVFKVPCRMLEFDTQPILFRYHVSKDHYNPIPLQTSKHW